MATITKTQLASAQNTNLQAFTALSSAVKDLLKANRAKAQRLNKDRQWVSNEGGLFSSNGIYRIDPATRTAVEKITFQLRDNGTGDFRAVDPENVLRGYTTLAHLAAKRGFESVTYRDYRGAENTLTHLDASYGIPVRVVFNAAALA